MILFNGAKTLGCNYNFDFVGDNFNYRTVVNLNINGEYRYVPLCELAIDQIGNSTGFSYISGGSGWIPLYGSGVVTGVANYTVSGLFNYSNGNPNVYFLGTGALASVNQPLKCKSKNVSGIWTNMVETINDFQDWDEIILNGVNLGSGVVKSINFDRSTDGYKRSYSATIELYRSGDISSLTGSGYQNTTLNADELKFVSSIQEDYDFTYGIDNRVIMNRSLGIQLISGDGLNQISTAQSIASGVVSLNSDVRDLVTGYTNFRRVYSEEYNISQGSYRFSETINRDRDPARTYSWDYGHQLQLGDQGITAVSENGLVFGVHQNKYAAAISGWNNVRTGIYARVSGVYANYLPNGSGVALTNRSVQFDKYNGTVNYNYNYNDDPAEKDCVVYSRESSINRSDNGIYTLNENGNIIGKCGNTTGERLEQASGYFYNNVAAGILSRLTGYYTGFVEETGCFKTFNKTSHEHGISAANATFDYNYTYTSDATNQTSGSFLIQTQSTKRDSLYNISPQITPYNGEIVQGFKQASMIEEDQSIRVRGGENGSTYQNFLDQALANISLPNVTPYYLLNSDISFTPDQSELNLRVTYKYTGQRTRNNSNV